MRSKSMILSWILIVAILAAAFSAANPVLAARTVQADDARQKAAALLESMTPEEKIGQLFVVTFFGRNLSPETDIYQLVVNQHVGGVILRSDLDNFTGPEDTIQTAYEMISSLQNLSWESSTDETKDVRYVPLFIGLSQDGDGYPTDQILSGLTSLPNQMTIGATWKTEDAVNAGAALGADLSRLGVNLLIGPSLDVLDMPLQEGGDDLGARSFGGDPFWVGEMAKSYISGIHTGSQNRVAVFSKHFPGRGSADRPLEAEVPTVRKSLEQLKQIELAPFFAVTKNLEADSNTDGLMVSHIRYQGFQGNIRATTKPVSLDPSALSQIIALPEFTAWRDNGGLLLSDNLGSLAIRRFTDPTLQNFDAKQTARSAFLAGSDLLYVDNFAGTGDENSYELIKSSIDFFTQRYNLDPAFAERVNQSVLRILTLKFQLYPDFDVENVNGSPDALTQIGSQSGLDYSIAQDAASLINPSLAELSSVLTDPPDRRERNLIPDGYYKVRQCSTCPETVELATDSLERSILEAYGPSSGNQVVDERLTSYSFQQVLDWLNQLNAPPNLEQDIRLANWIVIGSLDTYANRPSSLAFKRMLSEKSELLRNKKVVVFAFNAPYYLDSTDLSKVTAYYGIYCKLPACVNVARSILFQELSPRGASPVSIPGVGYDLITATSPDPDQIIPLLLDLPEVQIPTPSGIGLSTLTPVAPPEYKIGDTLPVRTGVIVDHNGRAVPDGTVVRFIINNSNDVSAAQQIESITTDGIAHASYKITSKGLMQIHVIAEPALTSAILQLDVPEDAGAIVVAVEPSPIPDSASISTETPTPTSTPTEVPTGSGTGGKPGFLEWLLAIMTMAGGFLTAYYFGMKTYSIRWGIRWGLCTILAGLLIYLYLALDLPGGFAWLNLMGTSGLLLGILLFMALGWVVGFLWHAWTVRSST